MRWRMDAAIVAVLLVIHGPETGAQGDAQKSRVRYDASNGGLESDALVAGKVHRLVLERLNPICYAYTATVSTTRAAFDLKAAEALLGSASTPDSAVSDSPAVVVEGSTYLPPAAATKDTSNAGRLVMWAEERLYSAAVALEDAGAVVSELQESQSCQNPIRAQHLLMKWAEEGAGLRQRMESLPRTIRQIRDTIRAAEKLVDSGLRNRVERLQRSTDTLEAKAVRLRGEFERAARQLDSASRQATVESDFWTSRDDEQVSVKIVQRSLRDGKTEEATFSVPTERRHRLRFSTGIIGSGVGSMHFDRINRPAQRDSGVTDSAQASDSTYSTWARVSGNGLDVVNPALLVSVSFGVSAIDLNASVGTTLRGVNGGTPSLEPLVAISLGTLDRFFLHGGVHLGRREKLLLLRPGEDADDVRLRAIPTNLTRGDVVGVEWVVRPFAGFSLRLN